MLDEKRKEKRSECFVPVEGQGGSAFGRIKSVDFSRGGIGLISQRLIPLNKEITVELDLDEQGDPVFAVGVVKWVTKIAGSNNFRVGLSFKEVLSGSKSRLNTFFNK